MTFNGHFTLNFYYYVQPFENLFLHTYRWAEMCGSGPWSAEYLGSAEGPRIFRRLHRRNLYK